MSIPYNTYANIESFSNHIDKKSQITTKNTPRQSDSAVFGLPDVSVELLGSVMSMFKKEDRNINEAKKIFGMIFC